MGTTPDAIDARRRGLGLARGFAVVLFGFAALLGAVAALGAAMLATRGRGSDALVLVSSGTIAGILGWLGARLWADRPIPGWFMAGFVAVLFLVPFVGLLAERRWGLALSLIGSILPGLFQFWPVFTKAKDAGDGPA